MKGEKEREMEEEGRRFAVRLARWHFDFPYRDSVYIYIPPLPLNGIADFPPCCNS